ncbi:VRR-NUC domain-containing protein [Vibrio europaeus]|uniref:VRR-NUC domain-containing protein n=1 Tax=Vibrio europaeus TaxID=300876 RepID=UPI002340CB2F|nr:VRR-NUC domain-containing protein [Vibrio europaeus]MDC5851572.1 VRR-NUC domain-containing protein [Vibrio europaeus]
MRLDITETIFSYPQSLLDDWKNGVKDWIPESLFVPQEVCNQSRYHFGEYYTLKQFLELGWRGTAYYALGDWEPENTKYDEGRAIVAEYINPIRLAMFKALRQGLTSGEPDLMLYKDDGSVLFVEVKKESDRISKSQLECLAQIKTILNCDVAVVYLAEEKQIYKPKTYQLNTGAIPSSWFERL